MTKAEQGDCILPFMIPQLDSADLREVVAALMMHLNLCVDVTWAEKYTDLQFTARAL